MTREELKEAYRMRDIVERYGFHPNRAGFLRCPFHDGDRQASLKIYEKDFYCFGCGAHGDIFEFIMRMDDVSFNEVFRDLGGSYQSGDKKTLQMRKIQFRKEKEERERREKQLAVWRRKRLNEVCRILRMLDVLLPSLKPFTEEWTAAITMRESNLYKYTVLTLGDRQEQEEMRKLNE